MNNCLSDSRCSLHKREVWFAERTTIVIPRTILSSALSPSVESRSVCVSQLNTTSGLVRNLPMMLIREIMVVWNENTSE